MGRRAGVRCVGGEQGSTGCACPGANGGAGSIAYYRAYSPTPVPFHTLVRVAGERWRAEECFRTSKGLTGLDQHQVRRWTSWHRWVTLAMLAHAYLTVIRSQERAARDGLIPVTVNLPVPQTRHITMITNHGCST